MECCDQGYEAGEQWEEDVEEEAGEKEMSDCDGR